MKSWPKVELYKVVDQLSKPLAYTIESHIWSLLAPIQMKSWSKVIFFMKGKNIGPNSDEKLIKSYFFYEGKK